MKEERLRITHLDKSLKGIKILEDINLALYAGEALGILGLHAAGKSTLLNIISGRDTYDSGAILLNEEGVSGKRVRAGAGIGLVRRKSSLVGNLSVAENIFVLRRHRRPKLLVRHRLLEAQARLQLEQLGIKLDPALRSSSLSDMEKYVIEIVKAYILGAQVILIDDFAKDYPREAYETLGRVVSTLKKRSVSFIISGSQLPILNLLCDRVALLYNRSILMTVDGAAHRSALERLLMEESGTRCLPVRPSSPVKGAPCFEVKNLYTEHIAGLSLCLHTGEVAALLDPLKRANEEFFALMQNARLPHQGRLTIGGMPYDDRRFRRQVVVTEFDMDKRLAGQMSLRDNLCLASYPRFCDHGIIRARRMRYVEQAFVQWYGDLSLLGLKTCAHLRDKDKVAIYLFGLRLQNPRLIVCADPSFLTDFPTSQMIMRELRSQADSGAAVCLLLSSPDQGGGIADRLIPMPVI